MLSGLNANWSTLQDEGWRLPRLITLEDPSPGFEPVPPEAEPVEGSLPSWLWPFVLPSDGEIPDIDTVATEITVTGVAELPETVTFPVFDPLVPPAADPELVLHVTTVVDETDAPVGLVPEGEIWVVTETEEGEADDEGDGGPIT